MVLGAGTMGAGIGQLAAMAGHPTTLYDPSGPARDKARSAIASSLEKLVAKSRIETAHAERTTARLQIVADADGALSQAEILVESVPESLELKQEAIARAVELLPATAIVGSNTSQLSITSVGARMGTEAERLVGMHFFNPPVLMQLVELVRGLRTSDATLQRARTFAEGIGKEVVVCQKDSPGFLTSRISAILRLECLRMLEEGLATATDIDKAVKLAFNHPMGPLELGDFNGLDTYLSALEGLAATHGDRFRPTFELRNLVNAGRLGRKTGAGIYDYEGDDGR